MASADVFARAQYSTNLGVDWTNARATQGNVTARANGRFGLEMRWALGDRWTFETGTDYVFRRVTWRRADGRRIAVDFDYIDVPVTFRWSVLPKLSLIAGGRLGIGVSDKVEVQSGTPAFDPLAHAAIALGEVGVRFDLAPRFALDLVFEREFGDFARDLREYRAGGARLVYLY